MSQPNHNKPVLIFVHIPKTAGGTLNSLIHRFYPKERIYRYEWGEEARLKFEALPVEAKNELDAIYGHLYFGIHSHLKRPYFYVTFLRDPIERLISAYYFIKERPHHPQYATTLNLSLREFYEQGYGGKEQDNGQTRILSGQYDIDTLCNSEMLELAKRHLKEQVQVVGITERFDESLLLISKHLNWNLPLYYERNVASKRPQKSEIPSDTLAFLQKYNEYDIELYTYACDLFDETVHQQSDNFYNQVKWFKMLNRLYKIPYKMLQTVKRTFT